MSQRYKGTSPVALSRGRQKRDVRRTAGAGMGEVVCTSLEKSLSRARSASGCGVTEEPARAEQGGVVRRGAEEREEFVCFSNEKTNVCKEEK